MLGAQNTVWQRDFFRHGSGVRRRRTMRPRTPLASRGRTHHRPEYPSPGCVPAEPDSVSPGATSVPILGHHARSIGHLSHALKIRGSGAGRPKCSRGHPQILRRSLLHQRQRHRARASHRSGTREGVPRRGIPQTARRVRVTLIGRQGRAPARLGPGGIVANRRRKGT